jgi:hypothetical protein
MLARPPPLISSDSRLIQRTRRDSRKGVFDRPLSQTVWERVILPNSDGRLEAGPLRRWNGRRDGEQHQEKWEHYRPSKFIFVALPPRSPERIAL